MHILFVARRILQHGAGGGMEAHGDTLVQGLSSRGHSVTIVTTRPRSGDMKSPFPDVRIHPIAEAPTGRYTRAFFQGTRHAFDEIHARFPVDVVLGQSSGARGLIDHRPRLDRQIPIACCLHGIGLWEYLSLRESSPGLLGLFGRLKERIKLAYERRFVDPSCRRYDAVIAVSTELAQAAIVEYGLSRERVHVVPNGVDPARFRPDAGNRDEFRRALGATPDDVLVAMAGRLVREKGYDLGLEALGKVAASSVPIRTVVAGEGPLRASLEALAARVLPGRAHFVGHRRSRALAEVYAASDIFLLPTRRWEGLPVSVLEAMSSERPVVATRMGGIPTAVEDGLTGRLVPPGDLEHLVAALQALATSQEERARLGRSARLAVQARFTSDTMVEGTLKALAGLRPPAAAQSASQT